MRFGLIHRLMTDALAALGLLALMTSGELNRNLTIALAIGLIGALLVPERWQDKDTLRHVGAAAPLAMLALQLVRLALGGNALNLAVEFAAALQVVRLATRRGAAHDQQVIVLALVHLIAGTVLGGGLAYGLCFLGFLIVAPGALALSHLRREVEGNYRQGARDRTGLPVDVPRILRSRRVIGKQFLLSTCLLSIPIFVFTAVLFVLFPRITLSLLLLNRDRSERMTGFSDRVDLGGVGTLRENPALVLRVEVPNLPEEPPERIALYLRGTAFDTYDGRAWSRSDVQRAPADRVGNYIRIARHPRPDDYKKLVVDLEPIDPPVIFTTDDAVSIHLQPRGNPLSPVPTVTRAAESEFRYVAAEDHGLRYELYANAVPREPRALRPASEARYLAMPRDLPPRIPELARRWIGDARTPQAAAEAIAKRLQTEYAYDLGTPSGAAPNPLDHFLFESKRGHCEYYSTAMAIMLRSVGVPTRNVTGFVGGTYNRFGRYYTVRQGDAHSWVEAYVEGKGWTRFDPTPAADATPRAATRGLVASLRDAVEAVSQRWNRNVVGYDLKQQLNLVERARKNYEGSGELGRFGRFVQDPKRAAATAAGVLLVAWATWTWWKRRGDGRGDDGKDPKTAKERSAREAASLYRQLEAALAARGVPRAPSTPPLAHALALRELRHPVADEALALTDRYLAARFGQRPLDEAEREDFELRVKRLRQPDESTRLAA